MTTDEIYEQYCKDTGWYNAKERRENKEAIMQTYDFNLYKLSVCWKEFKREFFRPYAEFIEWARVAYRRWLDSRFRGNDKAGR